MYVVFTNISIASYLCVHKISLEQTLCCKEVSVLYSLQTKVHMHAVHAHKLVFLEHAALPYTTVVVHNRDRLCMVLQKP